MVALCDKKIHSNKFLDFVQRIFCIAQKHANRIHRRVVHVPHHRKIRWLSYIHIVLLLLFFYLYNITNFQQANENAIPAEETPMTIQNEPQIIPDQAQAEATGEVFP